MIFLLELQLLLEIRDNACHYDLPKASILLEIAREYLDLIFQKIFTALSYFAKLKWKKGG